MTHPTTSGASETPPQEVWLTPERLATLPKGPQRVGQVGSLGTIMGIRVMTDCALPPLYMGSMDRLEENRGKPHSCDPPCSRARIEQMSAPARVPTDNAPSRADS